VTSLSKKPDPQKPIGPIVGEWNYLEATIGQRGMGKSTHQCLRALELVKQAQGQCYVIGHSLGARLPRKLPTQLGGHELPLEYHRTIQDLDKALRARPAKWHILAPPLLTDTKRNNEIARATCDDLIRYSIRLSESLRERAYAREHPLEIRRPVVRNYDGLHVPAIVILVDEGIAVESAGGSKSKTGLQARDWFLEWIYSLRHLHTALLYAIQNATARNWQILSEATSVYVFRVKHQWAINAVQAAGGTHREMKAVRKLEPHRFVLLGSDPALADDPDDEDEPIEEDEENVDSNPDPKPDAVSG
jgi:hypothetical protein